jgi:hypothetical protein
MCTSAKKVPFVLACLPRLRLGQKTQPRTLFFDTKNMQKKIYQNLISCDLFTTEKCFLLCGVDGASGDELVMEALSGEIDGSHRARG